MVPASAVSPIFFSTGVASPVRFDSSAAVLPLAISRVHGKLRAGLDEQPHAGLELLHLDLAFAALFIQRGGGLGRVAEERADFLLRAAQRVMLQRAGK